MNREQKNATPKLIKKDFRKLSDFTNISFDCEQKTGRKILTALKYLHSIKN